MKTDPAELRLAEELERRLGVPTGEARFAFVPYRVCPLGAHIDHQLGAVTALALDRGVRLAWAPSGSGEVRLASREFPGEVRFCVGDELAPGAGCWGNYARGAATVLEEAGHPLRRGLTGLVSGPWSEGGLSSSAALGIACLLALEEANGRPLDAEENLRLDHALENGFLGLRNGILDPAGVLLSRRGHLTWIDCATGRHRLLAPGPGMPPWAVVVAFSGLRRALVATDYNRRVGECREAARVLLEAAGRPAAEPVLGQVTAAEYATHRDRLPSPLDRRAAHFFSETDRVQQGVRAWERGDAVAFGALMTASGESSIRQYECGCPPMVELYEVLAATPGVFGARFSGAGFRGCCIALVDGARAADITASVRENYARRYPELAAGAPAFVCHSGDGAQVGRREGLR